MLIQKVVLTPDGWGGVTEGNATLVRVQLEEPTKDGNNQFIGRPEQVVQPWKDVLLTIRTIDGIGQVIEGRMIFDETVGVLFRRLPLQEDEFRIHIVHSSVYVKGPTINRFAMSGPLGVAVKGVYLFFSCWLTHSSRVFPVPVLDREEDNSFLLTPEIRLRPGQTIEGWIEQFRSRMHMTMGIGYYAVLQLHKPGATGGNVLWDGVQTFNGWADMSRCWPTPAEATSR